MSKGIITVMVIGSLICAGCSQVNQTIPYHERHKSVSYHPHDREGKGFYHTIKNGETLWSIAQAYAVSQDEIVRLNRLPNREHLEIEQMLFIPGTRQQE